MNIEDETKCCFPMIHSNHNNSVYIIVLLFIHLFKYTKEEKEKKKDTVWLLFNNYFNIWCNSLNYVTLLNIDEWLLCQEMCVG